MRAWVVRTAWVLALPAAGAGEVCHPELAPGPVFSVGDNFGLNALADLDRDGKLDLLVGLGYFLGDGGGGFGPRSDLPAPFPLAFDLVPADYDQDGLLDLAMVPYGSGEVFFYYGREGLELFDAPVAVDARPANVWHLAVQDLDEDGRLDLLGASIDAQELLLLFNDGKRRYRATTLRSTSQFPVDHMLTTGDFDGDGHADIATGRFHQTTLRFGRGDGTFGPEVFSDLRVEDQRPLGHRFRSADADGDGRSDLFVAAGRWALVYLGSEIDRDQGLRAEPSRVLDPRGGCRFVEIADLNADGELDVVTLAEAPAGAVLRVFVGSRADGTVSYTAGEPLETQRSGGGSVLGLGDVDNDGLPDAVLTTEDTQEGQVFVTAADCEVVAEAVPGDVDADGRLTITDAIAILRFLFAGQRIACPLAAEVDGTGTTNLSDAVYLLRYLFRGGDPPYATTPRPCRS